MNKIYKVIFNRTRGMYQVVSEIAKSVSSKKSETTKIKNACLALLILLAVGGTGNMYTSYAAEPSGSTTATTPENQDIALLKRLLQELQDKQALQSNIIQTNKDAITDITKAGGKLDQTIDQVNTMVGTLGDSMTVLQNKQKDSSGEIAKLKTSVADITKQGGALDKAIQDAVQKLTSTGGAVDTNKKAIATNAGDIQANKTQIGKNTE